MFKIDPDQIEVLEDHAYRQFLEHAVDHMTLHFPPAAERLGASGLRAAAHSAVKRGETYGFENVAELTLFIDLSVMLGTAFDTDPSYSWASDILAGAAELATPAECMDSLWDRGMVFFDATLGDADAVFPAEAYRSASSLFDAADYREIESPEGMLADYMQIWPEKAEAVGEEALIRLSRASFSRATEMGLASPGRVRDFARLAYLLGHRFDEDPMHPWARTALADAYFDAEAAVQNLRDGVQANVYGPWLAFQVKG